MSVYKNNKLLLLLIVSMCFFLFACMPFKTVDDEDTAEIGQPSIECSSNGQLVIVFPASKYYMSYIDEPSDAILYVDADYVGGRHNVASTTPNTVVFYTPSPPFEISNARLNLWINSQINFQSSFSVTLPACKTSENFIDQYKPNLITDGITHSCDGDVLVISFEFDQPVSGDLMFQWEDDEQISGSAKSVTVTALVDTVVSFRLEDAYAQEGKYNIWWPDLGFTRPEGFTSIYRPHDVWHWESCSLADELLALDRVPEIYNATCLQGKQLMIAFEFPSPVIGQYAAQVDGKEYQYTAVSAYPNRAYFFGPPPEYQGPVSVSLSTIPDGTVVFEQQDYEFPACGVQRPEREDGGDGGYVPPSY